MLADGSNSPDHTTCDVQWEKEEPAMLDAYRSCAMPEGTTDVERTNL
jgi:hypothetical protein